ncbi:uncharacterized protein ccdc178 isoform 1-T1 [Syngnathus typhle]
MLRRRPHKRRKLVPPSPSACLTCKRCKDLNIQISKSKTAVRQMCEEKQQMLQKVAAIDEQREIARRQVTRIAAQHRVAWAALKRRRRQLTFTEEQRVRGEMETLQNELTGQVMEGLKCVNINEELQQYQTSSNLINHKTSG